jgi:hypothetical protein
VPYAFKSVQRLARDGQNSCHGASSHARSRRTSRVVSWICLNANCAVGPKHIVRRRILSSTELALYSGLPIHFEKWNLAGPSIWSGWAERRGNSEIRLGPISTTYDFSDLRSIPYPSGDLEPFFRGRRPRNALSETTCFLVRSTRTLTRRSPGDPPGSGNPLRSCSRSQISIRSICSR